MAKVEAVHTVVTAVIAFTESELVFMKNLTKNAMGPDESAQERTTRECLFLAFQDALKRR